MIQPLFCALGAFERGSAIVIYHHYQLTKLPSSQEEKKVKSKSGTSIHPNHQFHHFPKKGKVMNEK